MTRFTRARFDFNFLGAFCVLALILVAEYAVMLFANLWPFDRSCGWVFPKILSCVLGARESLAGGVIGVGGALFAAWIAWMAVQKQLVVQRQQALIDDLTFWQRKHDDAEVALKGLRLVDDISKRCLAIVGQCDPKDPSRYANSVKKMEALGLLDGEQFPRTGSNLIAWHMANYVVRLRKQQVRWEQAMSKADTSVLEDCELSMHKTLDGIQELEEQIPDALTDTNRDLTASNEALFTLKRALARAESSAAA